MNLEEGNSNENANLIERTNGMNNDKAPSTKKFSLNVMTLVVVSFVILIIILGGYVSYAPHYGGKRNVILMISDGFGPASETYGRTFAQYLRNSSYDAITPLDRILVGQSRTRSSDSLVTDSAAGATAFSCTLKTYNGAIGVDPQRKPCGTVLEAAKRQGFFTGLVATSRITHATPASFSAHVPHRDFENEIAVQQVGFTPLGRSVDLMFGGGRCHFLANTTRGSCRTDTRDLIKDAQQKGWKFVNKQEFESLKPKDSKHFPLAGLFALDHMDYEIDRDDSQQPSLKSMAEKALDLLTAATKKNSQGFFLMIEGSRIDMAAHSNDPAAHAHDILAYYDTVDAVRAYVAKHPDTVMISVSDHETGGFTLGRQLTSAYPEYVWYPDVIARVKHSAVYIAKEIITYSGKNKASFIKEDIAAKLMGIHDLTDKEFNSLQTSSFADLLNNVTDIVSRRANLGWTTHGHTGVDVNLYAYGSHAKKLNGSKENTDIGKFIEEFLDLDITAITEVLKGWDMDLKVKHDIMLSPKDPNGSLDSTVHS